VHNKGRTIAVTNWFDYFSKQAIVGSGKALPTDYLAGKLTAFKQRYGVQRPPRASPPRSALQRLWSLVGLSQAEQSPPLAQWRGCVKSLGGPNSHAWYRNDGSHECVALEPIDNWRKDPSLLHQFSSRHAAIQKEITAWRPLNGWADNNLDRILVQYAATRHDIRVAMANVTVPVKGQWEDFVEDVGCALFWKNRFWLRRVRSALQADMLPEMLAHFSLEESFRVLWDLRVEAEQGGQGKLVARMDHFLDSLHEKAFPLQPLDPDELNSPWTM